jgi:MFS family permease
LLSSNLWKLSLIQACRWFLLLMPILVLFYQENGLSLQDVFLVQACYSVCVIIFEVPSGYFADRFGRKRSIQYGSFFATLGFIAYAYAHAFTHFLIAQTFIALGASFISGSDTALLYDTLIQLEREHEYQKHAGRLASIANFSEGIAGIVGGWLALFSLRTPLYYQAALVAVAVPLAWTLIEPDRKASDTSEGSLKAIVRIVRYALHGHAEVKWLILYSSLVGTSTFVIVWFVQPYLVAIELPLAWFGVAWAVLQFSVGIFSLLAYRIEALLGRRMALISLILLSSTAYLLLGHFQTLYAAPVLFLFYLVRGINGPVLNDYINRCIDSDIRATVLSVRSLVGRVMFVLLGPVVGWVSDTYTLGAAFQVCGLTFLVCGVLLLWLLHRNKVL